jgi:hypothetical protein
MPLCGLEFKLSLKLPGFDDLQDAPLLKVCT